MPLNCGKHANKNSNDFIYIYFYLFILAQYPNCIFLMNHSHFSNENIINLTKKKSIIYKNELKLSSKNSAEILKLVKFLRSFQNLHRLPGIESVFFIFPFRFVLLGISTDQIFKDSQFSLRLLV